MLNSVKIHGTDENRLINENNVLTISEIVDPKTKKIAHVVHFTNGSSITIEPDNYDLTKSK